MIMILDLPENIEEIGEWLDRHIASDRLSAVVNELTAVHNAATESLSVEEGRDWLAEDAAKVCQEGLRSIGHQRICDLLRRPALLPAIQEFVMLEGGEYWGQLLQGLSPLPPLGEIVNNAVSDVEPASLSKARRNFWTAVLSLSVAASIGVLLLSETGNDKARPRDAGLTLTRGEGREGAGNDVAGQPAKWGWCREDLMPEDARPEEVAGILADSLGEWFTVSRTGATNAKVVRLQVSELWDGCQQLSSRSFEGMRAENEQRVRGVAIDLENGLQVVLKDLRASAASPDDDSAADRARRAVDDLVRAAIASLRQIRN
jgi:hypothetical protein